MTPASPASAMLPVDDWADERTRVDLMVVVCLEVEGTTEGAASQRFVSGDACPPLTVGRAGQFRIEGRGVLDVHAFVHFDGTCVFVCSTDATSPVMVGDQALPRRWTPIAPGTKLRFGDVVVAVLARTESAAAVGAADVRSPLAESCGERNVVPSVVVDDDATRIDPLRGATDEATRIEPPSAALVPEPMGVAHEATVILPARVEKKRKRRRVLLVGAGAVAVTWALMALAVFVLTHHRKASATSTTAASSTVAPRPSPQPDPVGECPVPTGVVVHAAPARSAVTRSATKQPPSAERQAVDALHAGDVARALALYQQLATEQPDNPAFARAATILRARTPAGGTP